MEPDNPLLDKYFVEQIGKRSPSVCFVPTAAGDADPDLYKSEAAVLSEIVRRRCSGDLADIGCGTAYWLPFYADQCRHITLLDQSEEMLSEAGRKAEKLGMHGRTSCRCGDVLHEEFQPRAFDTALVGFLMSHLSLKEEPHCCPVVGLEDILN